MAARPGASRQDKPGPEQLAGFASLRLGHAVATSLSERLAPGHRQRYGGAVAPARMASRLSRSESAQSLFPSQHWLP
jgi:hypothetical protein